MSHDSRALTKLRHSLEARADLLDCLEVAELRDESQQEIPSALPQAILFGHMKFKGPLHRRPLVWIYLCRKSLTLMFHSYLVDGRPGGLLIVDDVLKKAAPVAAFDFATDPFKLVVLATYYFMRYDQQDTEHLCLTTRQEDVLLSICEDVNRASGSYIKIPPRSKVVKLKCSVSPSLFEPSTPLNGKRKRGTVECSDIGNDGMESRRHESTISIQSSCSTIASEQQSADTQLPSRDSLEDDNSESDLRQLDRKRRRIEELRENLEAMQQELDREVEETLAMLDIEEEHSPGID
ncbi:hypothetical protein DE146DRAFT_320497 [Phaeosphaeria sp. MPI-PUGE-AT-0046c]|nr:hypothetical protein DE146DRAFT_320497 [Phaeosphaeria sp. MPI-PUGE-AT-0046c]